MAITNQEISIFVCLVSYELFPPLDFYCDCTNMYRCSLWWFLPFPFWLLHMIQVTPASSENISKANTSCIEEERQALLSFRNGLTDPEWLLSSWHGEDKDCCGWAGVHCNPRTGHITALDLSPNMKTQDKRYFYLRGEIGPSLLNLTYLRYLDLSCNTFSTFPTFIGTLHGLKYVNLSCRFESKVIVPSELGNLSKLEYLDLGCWNHNVRIESLEWISSLSSLTHLEMNGLNLSSIPNSFQSIMNIPSLVSFSCQDCIFSIPSFPSNFNHSKSLKSIYLSGGELNSPVALFRWLNASHALVDLTLSFLGLGFQDSIWDFLGTMTSLEHLDLSGNDIQGQIPMSLGKLHKLQTLDLSYNRLNGTPDIFQNWTRYFSDLREFHAINNELSGSFDFTKFKFLEVLDISKNRYNGILPQSIWKLSNLTVLNVRSNSFEGVISDSHISNLQKLKLLDLSFNSFKLNFSSNWVPPFQLDFLDLSSCKLSARFPNWISTQKNLVHLGISDSGISDFLPSWFWDISNKLKYLNISHNNIMGKVPNLFSGEFIDLSSNQFDGPLPQFSHNLFILNLSKNKFSGNISVLCTQNFQVLLSLDLSSNLFSGHLPDCWMNFKALNILDLSSNGFQGTIPGSMATLSNLLSLRLSNNKLLGTLPSNFHWQRLNSLGLGENQLSGNIPLWICSLSELVVLELYSNKISGKIPQCLCQMQKIQILDLSFNSLSNTIPTCLDNLTIMARKTSEQMNTGLWLIGSSDGDHGGWYSFANAWVTWKGMKVEYKKTLALLKLIDLSSNKLSGEIPVELTSLYGLVSLNLSRNMLTGVIPQMIGKLEQLDSLDLSNNQLSGKIPGSLSSISRLSFLDLSKNKLSGKIPSSTQMLSFDATQFEGNLQLCGLPLTRKCPGGDGDLHPPIIITNNHDNEDHSDSEQEEKKWFYNGILVGFAVGFWGICGPLMIYAPFRIVYFQFMIRVKDKTFVLFVIALRLLQS